MNNKNMILRQIVYKTNELNNFFLDVAQSVFNQKLGKFIKYNELLNNLQRISFQLENAVKEILCVIDSIPFEERDKTLFGSLAYALLAFQYALKDILKLLTDILINMQKKSENLLSYSIFAYAKDKKNYKQLEKIRLQRGIVLQNYFNDYNWD